MTEHRDGRDAESSAVMAAASAALEDLAGLLRNKPELDRLLDGYLETRRALSDAFRRLTQASVPATSSIEVARRRIEEQMRRRYQAVFPAPLLAVRKYSKTHALLLAYLEGRTGAPVPASRLRVLTGDQVHTERRVRELRDLGFSIDATRVAGDNVYVLKNTLLDLEHATSVQLSQNVGTDKTLSPAQKRGLLTVLASG